MEYGGTEDADSSETLAADGDEHGRLVSEIPAIQRLPIGERLLLARRRRMEQVTRYEHWQFRDAADDGRHPADILARRRRPSRTLRFAGAVSLLEAVRGSDVNEGSSTTVLSNKHSFKRLLQ